MTSDYFSPNNVLVVTFGDDPENDRNAYQALTDLKQLDSQDQIKITGAAVIARDGDGRVDVKSDVGEDPSVGTASCAVTTAPITLTAYAAASCSGVTLSRSSTAARAAL